MHDIAITVLKRIHEAGFIAYFAGGCVRDSLLNLTPTEIDIATSATPAQVMSLFPKTVAIGAQFGVVLVLFQGHSFEVATFRHDEGFHDGRHPDHISFCSAREDAKRRDFTINGLFFDPLTDTLYDFVSGQEDLKNRLVRAIGIPQERFQEDKLRMLRAVRFATHFDFTLDNATAVAIREQASTLLASVSMERIYQEFSKMAQGPRPTQAFHLLDTLGLLFPPLKAASFTHYPTPCPTIFYLHALAPDIDICTLFKTSNHDRKLLHTLLSMPTDDDPVAWAHYYALPDSWTCIHITHTDLSTHHARRTHLTPHIDRIIHRTPLVTASMLLARGIPPGPYLGSLLRRAERLAIELNLSSPDSLLDIFFPPR